MVSFCSMGWPSPYINPSALTSWVCGLQQWNTTLCYALFQLISLWGTRQGCRAVLTHHFFRVLDLVLTWSDLTRSIMTVIFPFKTELMALGWVYAFFNHDLKLSIFRKYTLLWMPGTATFLIFFLKWLWTCILNRFPVLPYFLRYCGFGLDPRALSTYKIHVFMYLKVVQFCFALMASSHHIW